MNRRTRPALQHPLIRRLIAPGPLPYRCGTRCAALADRIKLAVDSAVPPDTTSFEVVGSLALIIAWTIAVHDHLTPEQKKMFRERTIAIINTEIAQEARRAQREECNQ